MSPFVDDRVVLADIGAAGASWFSARTGASGSGCGLGLGRRLVLAVLHVGGGAVGGDAGDELADGDGVALGDSTSVTVPATGEGISESTLSVEISRSGSSTAMASPGAFSQAVIVPSVTVSPICGIRTSTDATTAGSAMQVPQGPRRSSLRPP